MKGVERVPGHVANRIHSISAELVIFEEIVYALAVEGKDQANMAAELKVVLKRDTIPEQRLVNKTGSKFGRHDKINCKVN